MTATRGRGGASTSSLVGSGRRPASARARARGGTSCRPRHNGPVRHVLLDRLACPLCRAQGHSSAFEVDPTRIGGGEDGGAPGELIEGYLVCLRCRAARPVVGGTPILPLDLDAHLASHGNVYRRLALGDPRIVRLLLGRAGDGVDVVPFAEVLARYADLLPAEVAPPRPPAPVDLALDAALREARVRGPALEIGCGVGRGTFLLAARTGDAVGIDRSVARVRRALHVAIADEFLLPAVDGAPAEASIDLAALPRDLVDFAVADPEALPFRDAVFATVVLHPADGDGPLRDPAAARAEAERVLIAGGDLFVESMGAAGAGPAFERVSPRSPRPEDAPRVGSAPS